MPIYIIRSTCAVSRWPFPGVFAMCFIGIDGLFSLSETMIVTLFYAPFARLQSYTYIFRLPTWKSNFSMWGGNFRVFTLILINTADIFAVVDLIHGGLFLEISLIILFY